MRAIPLLKWKLLLNQGIRKKEALAKTLLTLPFLSIPRSETYVRRIEFRGNTRTADEVLRREMRQMESAPASSNKIDVGKLRLNRLGYFESVEVETIPVAGTEDQVDVIYEVAEQNSGSISASVGYAQTSGLILNGSLTENNFLGTGNAVSLNVSRSRFQTSYGISYTDPYFTVDGVSAGFNIYSRATDFSEINISTFNTDAVGLGVNFGYPISENSFLNFGLGYEILDLTTGIFAPEEVQNLNSDDNNFSSYKLSLSWRQSALNRGLLPTGGYSQQLGVEVALPGSDLSYYKASYTGQIFLPLFAGLVLRLRSQLGFGDGYGDVDRLPFFENYFAGGFGSVRGYETNTLGPRETPAVNGITSNTFDANGVAVIDDNGVALTFPNFVHSDIADPIGGNFILTGSAEIILPIPFLKDNRSVQAVLFYDYGNVFDTQCGVYAPRTLSNGALVPERRQENCSKPAFDELRYSAGLGVTWISGFGPLTFSIGQTFNTSSPVNNGLFQVREEEDQFFQFSLGQTF